VPGRILDRRDFLRAASVAAVGAAAAACSTGSKHQDILSTQSPSSSSSPGHPAPLHKVSWRAIGTKGPKPRTHHTFTANADGSLVYLFGGRTQGRVFRDAWAFERDNGLWQPLPFGPPERFGHSAAYANGHLLIFGGQAGGGQVYSDVWAFDPIHGTWVELKQSGSRPAGRWGASGTTIASSLTISHGLTSSGPADDTWALATRWTNVTPRASRPPKRALHRAVYASGLTRMVLFGGVSGSTLLGDTWGYDPISLGWTRVGGPGPAPRRLFAACATKSAAYVYGGSGRKGPLGDAWWFDGSAWRQLHPSGRGPSARFGADGALTTGPSMLLFGGNDGTNDLDDLWELTLPV